jgi:hypothetical protein
MNITIHDDVIERLVSEALYSRNSYGEPMGVLTSATKEAVKAETAAVTALVASAVRDALADPDFRARVRVAVQEGMVEAARAKAVAAVKAASKPELPALLALLEGR